MGQSLRGLASGGFRAALLRFVRRRPRAAAALLLLALSGPAAAAAWDASRNAELLRGDPDLLPGKPALMAFALPRGRRGFQAYCAACHGSDGRGDSDIGAPNLADQDWLYGSGKVGEIETVILYGVRAAHPKTWKLAQMPAYAQSLPYPREPALKPLSPGDIRDVTAFLLSIEGRAPASDASHRGSAIFAGRGGCFDCHGADAHGDPGVGAPNLADNIWLYGSGSPDEIFASIAYGHAGVCPAWAGRLQPAEIREIALYVHSISDRPAQIKGGGA